MEYINYASRIIKEYCDVPVKQVFAKWMKRSHVDSYNIHPLNKHINIVIYKKDIESLQMTYAHQYNSFKEPTQAI